MEIKLNKLFENKTEYHRNAIFSQHLLYDFSWQILISGQQGRETIPLEPECGEPPSLLVITPRNGSDSEAAASLKDPHYHGR